MNRLRFEKKSNGDFKIWNDKGEKLGDIQRIRVGQFMQWVLTNVPSRVIFFSPGCQDEVREMCRKLKSAELSRKVQE